MPIIEQIQHSEVKICMMFHTSPAGSHRCIPVTSICMLGGRRALAAGLVPPWPVAGSFCRSNALLLRTVSAILQAGLVYEVHYVLAIVRGVLDSLQQRSQKEDAHHQYDNCFPQYTNLLDCVPCLAEDDHFRSAHIHWCLAQAMQK